VQFLNQDLIGTLLDRNYTSFTEDRLMCYSGTKVKRNTTLKTEFVKRSNS